MDAAWVYSFWGNLWDISLAILAQEVVWTNMDCEYRFSTMHSYTLPQGWLKLWVLCFQEQVTHVAVQSELVVALFALCSTKARI